MNSIAPTTPPPYPPPDPPLSTTLMSARFVIRPPRATDVPELRRTLRASAEHLRPWNPPPASGEDPTSVTAVSRSVATHRRVWRRGESFPFLVMPAAHPERLAGRVTLGNVVRGAFHSVHLGYWTSEEHVGTGVATEAVARVIDFAFTEAGLHRVQAAIIERNTRSLRVVEKLGFRHEGLSPRYLFIDGRWQIAQKVFTTEMRE